MIDLIFHHANEVIIVRVVGNVVTFGNTTYGAKMADISGIKLDFQGTIREFPDLEKDVDWRDKAIKRFKELIKSFKREEDVASYVIHELRNQGYIPRLKQVAGMRSVRIK